MPLLRGQVVTADPGARREPPWVLRWGVVGAELRQLAVIDVPPHRPPVVAVQWPRVRVTQPPQMPDRPSMIVLRRRRDQATRSPMPGGLAAMLSRPIRA